MPEDNPQCPSSPSTLFRRRSSSPGLLSLPSLTQVLGFQVHATVQLSVGPEDPNSGHHCYGDISPALILPSLVCSLSEKRRSTDCLKEEEGFQPCHLQEDCRGHLTALFPPLALERAAPALCFSCCHGINRTAHLFRLASLSRHSGGRTGVFALTVYRGTIPTEGRVPGWPRAKHGAWDTLESLLLLSLLSGVLRSAPLYPTQFIQSAGYLRVLGRQQSSNRGTASLLEPT